MALDSSKDNKKDSLEKMSDRLYRNDGFTTKHREGILHQGKYDAPGNWVGEKTNIKREIPQNNSTLKKVFVGSLLFFIVSIVFSLYSFYGGRNIVSNENINFSIFGPAFTEGGNEVELQFDIKNSNPQELQYTDLIIEYPKGATLEGDNNVIRLRKSLGSIGAGKSISERANITLFGEEGSERIVKATIEYRIQGSNAIFVKETTYTVHIKSSPISLNVKSLKEVNANQEITLEIEVLANSEKVVEDMILRVDYPAGFTRSDVSPDTSFSNNIWKLGDLNKGAKKKVIIHGTLLGEDGDERSFRIYAGRENDSGDDIGVIYNSVLQTVIIKRAFLEAKLSINKESGTDFIVPSGSQISAELNWINNLPNRVLDTEFYVHIIGDAFDRQTVRVSGGFFNSSDNTITWNKDTSPELAQLQGGDSGKFSFSFNLSSPFSGNRTTYKNASLIFEVGVRARRIGENNVPEQISALERKTVKISSNVQLRAVSLYYNGPFKNTGGLPPRAEKETTYTISLNVLNASNDLSRAKVLVSLPSYVRFIGNTSPTSEDVSFNNDTREVSWDMGRVNQGTGVETDTRQVSFQVGLTPSLSQVGNEVPLTGDFTLIGEDDFTGSSVTVTKSAVSTKLISDTGVKNGDDIIVK